MKSLGDFFYFRRKLHFMVLRICCLFLVLSSFWVSGQSKSAPLDRLEKNTSLFKQSLIRHFIHPEQLDAQNWAQCQASIQHLVQKFEEDFIAVRLEKAFKRSEVTNYFSPVFIYADGREFRLTAFRIMQ